MNTESTEKLLDLEDLELLHGAHTKRSEGLCLLEAVAWFAGEKHSDRPACTDVALAAYGRAFNDRLRADERQLLKPLIPRLVGTKGSPDLARRRAYLLVDHSCAPTCRRSCAGCRASRVPIWPSVSKRWRPWSIARARNERAISRAKFAWI